MADRLERRETYTTRICVEGRRRGGERRSKKCHGEPPDVGN
jgi:hypothetical protein